MEEVSALARTTRRTNAGKKRAIGALCNTRFVCCSEWHVRQSALLQCHAVAGSPPEMDVLFSGCALSSPLCVSLSPGAGCGSSLAAWATWTWESVSPMISTGVSAASTRAASAGLLQVCLVRQRFVDTRLGQTYACWSITWTQPAESFVCHTDLQHCNVQCTAVVSTAFSAA